MGKSVTEENWKEYAGVLTPFTEDQRNKNIAGEPRYETMKSLPWNTQDLNVNTNGNGKVLLEQLKTFDLDWAFLLTYWNFDFDEIRNDFSKYVGEKIGLESNYLIQVEKIEENTEKAMAITGGEEFYICTFHTLEGGDLALYLFSTRTTPVSTYLNAKTSTHYVEGWPIGVDENGRIVIAQ
ncbi:MAG: hypothetical protein U0M15_07180 [Bacillota bacterium]|nr:hypothetical protein [Bacillota bacterium]